SDRPAAPVPLGRPRACVPMMPPMATFDDYGGWPALLTHLLDRNHLTAEQAKVVMSTILAGDATPAQIVGFLVALRAKGESAEELGGLLEGVLEHAALVDLTAA